MGKYQKKKKLSNKAAQKTAKKDDYIFKLERRSEGWPYQKIQINFLQGFQGKQNQVKMIFPTFLKDGNHKTPAFVVPYFNNSNQHQQTFQYKFTSNLSDLQNSDYLFEPPGPISNRGTCKLCRYYFDNYFAHIGTDRHNRNMMHAPYTNKIKQFCQQKYGNRKKQSLKLQNNSEQTIRIPQTQIEARL